MVKPDIFAEEALWPQPEEADLEQEDLQPAELAGPEPEVAGEEPGGQTTGDDSEKDEATEERAREQQPQRLWHRWKVKELQAEHKAKLKHRDAECKRRTAK